MISFTVILLAIYAFYLWLHRQAISFEEPNEILNPKAVGVSIIIPFRNEASHLPQLLKSLAKHEYDAIKAEIIFVDDHSTDQSISIVEEHMSSISIPCRIEHLPEDAFGKKSAVKHAVTCSQYDVILTTDADCQPEPNWIKTMILGFIEKKVDLLSGPVRLISNGSWIHKFQLTEWMAISSLTIGGFKLKLPFSSNAANLMFSKTLYKNFAAQDKNMHVASGDDIFLLHYAIKNKYACDFLSSKYAIVNTPAADSLTSLIEQRVRWAGKSTHVRNLNYLIGMYLIAIMNGCVLYWYAMSLTFYAPLFILAVVFNLKWTLDSYFIYKMSRFFEQKVSTNTIILTSLIYPIYIWTIGILSLMIKPKWKTRKT